MTRIFQTHLANLKWNEIPQKSQLRNTGQLEWYVCNLFGEIINDRSFLLYCQTKINYARKSKNIDTEKQIEEE